MLNRPANSEPESANCAGAARQGPWDARLARRLIAPLKDSWVTPEPFDDASNCGRTRCRCGLFARNLRLVESCRAAAGAVEFSRSHRRRAGAHERQERAGYGHIYDLASDAAVTILLFVAIGVGVGAKTDVALGLPPVVLGAIAGIAIALIFFLRMRIEDKVGKVGTRQASLGGFETEDVLYLLPLVTLCDCVMPFLMSASICAPLFAIWVSIDYRRAMHRLQLAASQSMSG